MRMFVSTCACARTVDHTSFDDYSRMSPCFQLTLADIYVYDLVYQLKKVRNYDALTKFPTLGSLKSKVEGNPDIAKYLSTRKDTPR